MYIGHKGLILKHGYSFCGLPMCHKHIRNMPRYKLLVRIRPLVSPERSDPLRYPISFFLHAFSNLDNNLIYISKYISTMILIVVLDLSVNMKLFIICH